MTNMILSPHGLADQRVRLAANLAFNRQTANEAETLGRSQLTGVLFHAVRLCPAARTVPL